MTRLLLNDKEVDIDLAIFDKDGTLIDFDFFWGERTRGCVEHLLAQIDGDEGLRAALFRTLGYDPATGITAGDGPLASATMDKLYNIATVVLYQHGYGWDEAESLIKRHFSARMGAAPSADLVRPLGDVPALFASLDRAGVKIAIVTSDDHDTAAQTMALLGVAQHVSAIVGGDDDMPMKPAPDAILHVCRQLGIAPARTLMVGDTVTDMVMATRAGAGQRAGVLSGVGTAKMLGPHTDVLLRSIAEIQLSNSI